MTVEEFKEIIPYNEPTFSYKGIEYTICHPNDEFYVRDWSKSEPESTSFSDVDDLLNHWIIQGKSFREVLPYTDLE